MAAVLAVKKLWDERIIAALGFHFGKFSERDRALIAAVWQVAYRRGYKRRTRETEQAAA